MLNIMSEEKKKALELAKLYTSYAHGGPLQSRSPYRTSVDWIDYINDGTGCPNFHNYFGYWRVKPPVTRRPISIDELPVVFMVKDIRSSNQHTYAMMKAYVRVETIASLIATRSVWSTDGVIWKPFEVEDK